MDHSPLGHLPEELRLAIYEYVLVEPEEVRVVMPADGRPLIASPSKLGLTATCKEIRSKCLPIFYSLNRFYFHTACHDDLIKPGWDDALNAWLEAIGDANRRRLRHVGLDVGSWHSLRATKMWGTACDFLDRFWSYQQTNILFKVTLGWTRYTKFKHVWLCLDMSNLERAQIGIEAAIAEVQQRLGKHDRSSTAFDYHAQDADLCVRRLSNFARLLRERHESRVIQSDH